MKKTFKLAGIAFLILLAVVLFRAWRAGEHSEISLPAALLPPIDSNRVADHLGRFIQFQTVSLQQGKLTNPEVFLGARAYLEKTFPLFHKKLRKELVNDSLLYTWKGSDPTSQPVLFLAHYDVVPAIGLAEWKYPPFQGVIADGRVWGRGALDDKASVLGLIEATEKLLEEGFVPRATFYFAFGHDEEVGGETGASKIASLLRSRGIHPQAIFDEGGFVVTETVPGITKPVAFVGIAEKGYLSIELTALSDGGHSSMPPPQTAIGKLSHAIDRLEKNPLPASLQSPTREMLASLTPHFGFGTRVILSNLWLFEPLVIPFLVKSPRLGAALRTTTAPTIFQAGVKDNVLPESATAVVNFRLIPGETESSLIDQVKQRIQDSAIQIKPLQSFPPTAVSKTDSPSFNALTRTIHEIFPATILSPNLTVGATDSRHYATLTQNVYRFLPLSLSGAELGTVHGSNESVKIADYVKAIQFYSVLMKRL